MNDKDTTTRTEYSGMLVHNSEYFKYIFKKTEKIVCAVFYTTRTEKDSLSNDTLITDVESAAQRLLDSALQSLRATEGSQKLRVEALAFATLELESKLRILHAAHLLRSELHAVFMEEIDTVLRSLRPYIKDTHRNPLYEEPGEVAVRGRDRKRESGTREYSVERGGEQPRLRVATSTTSELGSRKERIIAILKEKGHATIKDISEHITDCSEKTIQRELIALIKDGSVVREGERRWSKYSLSV